MTDENKAQLAALSKGRKYRSSKIQATPKWLSDTDKKLIKSFQRWGKMFGELNNLSLEVDHICPLQGEYFTGLHLPWNLQLILGSENSAKMNKPRILTPTRDWKWNIHPEPGAILLYENSKHLFDRLKESATIRFKGINRKKPVVDTSKLDVIEDDGLETTALQYIEDLIEETGDLELVCKKIILMPKLSGTRVAERFLKQSQEHNKAFVKNVEQKSGGIQITLQGFDFQSLTKYKEPQNVTPEPELINKNEEENA